MIKAMLFIDGSWLQANLSSLGQHVGRSEFQIDFGKLPKVLATELDDQFGVSPVDMVRCHYFGSYADNFDARDQLAVRRRLSFFGRLREEHGYEVDAFPTNFQGRRLRPSDREPGDDFAPKEKCVDVALSVTVLRYAYMAGVMDLALFLIGDRDFVPLLQELRRLGKRVIVVSIDGSCAEVLAEPTNAEKVRDHDVVWLNDLAGRIESRGDRRRPTARRSIGRPDEPQPPPLAEEADDAAAGRMLRGTVKNIIWDRGYGFIAAEDARDYFFHANALEDGLAFEDLQPDMTVVFEVKAGPTAGRAGAARAVFRDPGNGRPAPSAGAENDPEHDGAFDAEGGHDPDDPAADFDEEEPEVNAPGNDDRDYRYD